MQELIIIIVNKGGQREDDWQQKDGLPDRGYEISEMGDSFYD